MPNDNKQQVQKSDPPILGEDSVLPPTITTPPQNKDQDIKNPSPAPTDSGSSSPTDDIANIPPVVTGSVPKKKFGGGKVIATILGLFLLIGGLGAGTYLVQQNQDIREKAGENEQPSDCVESISDDPDLDGACLDLSEENTDSDNPELDSDEDEEESIDLTEDVGDELEAKISSTEKRIFLVINYTDKYCIDGFECNNLQKKTVVGWKGTNLSDGPRKIFGNNQLIPLTNKSGKWIKDKPVYRSSPLVKGLGVTRLGNGKIWISHAIPVVERSNYNKSAEAIDARFKLLGGGMVDRFINAYPKIVPDKPVNLNGSFAGAKVDFQADGTWSKPPFSKGSGFNNDQIVWNSGTKQWQHYTRIKWPGDDYMVKVTIDASCGPVKAYSSSWTPLNTSDLSKLKAGDKINFCVAGNTSGSWFDKAKFTINEVEQPETTSNRPDTSNEFCQEYQVPENTKDFNITAKIHHVTLGWK